MKPRLIVIDGKTYNSVNDMPEDVRRQYEQAMSSFKDQDGNHVPDAIERAPILDDRDRNGIPDAIESAASTSMTSNSFKVVLDGKEYHSLEDLPPEARARYEQAMGSLDANRNGIPDFVEGMLGGSVQPATPVSTSYAGHTTHHTPRQPMPVTPTFEPDRSNGWMLALLGALLFGLCLITAAGVWYFFLR